ncbi:hypothetical protein BCR43DRAFT_519448 [Syncephalastrum racemosum]|uniref:Uncharacterized protein n=1 Tax=Syncephalastrum racemosum TaxID=13706 RepID=A0A1X2GYX0_SYNRA|nr:hypothetical protein BCR43DRAFT_519448 [Syncephalastrum racemosum]
MNDSTRPSSSSPSAKSTTGEGAEHDGLDSIDGTTKGTVTAFAAEPMEDQASPTVVQLSTLTIGIIVCCVLVSVALMVVLFLLVRKRKLQQQQEQRDDPHEHPFGIELERPPYLRRVKDRLHPPHASFGQHPDYNEDDYDPVFSSILEHPPPPPPWGKYTMAQPIVTSPNTAAEVADPILASSLARQRAHDRVGFYKNPTHNEDTDEALRMSPTAYHVW